MTTILLVVHFDTAEFDELLAQIAKDDATKAEAQKKRNQALIDKFSQLDSAEAERLEQSSRAQTGEEGLRSLIEEALKKVEAQPENINALKDLVSCGVIGTGRS